MRGFRELSVILGFHDPVGFIQPVVIMLKILFQMICKEEYGWDDEIDDELRKKWVRIIDSIQGTGPITIDMLLH